MREPVCTFVCNYLSKAGRYHVSSRSRMRPRRTPYNCPLKTPTSFTALSYMALSWRGLGDTRSTETHTPQDRRRSQPSNYRHLPSLYHWPAMVSQPSAAGSQLGPDTTEQQPVCSPISHRDPVEGPDVVIKTVSAEIGRGVFAGKSFKHGELIFQEAPVITATHDTFHEASTRDAPAAYDSLPERDRLLMQAAFTTLARPPADGAASSSAPKGPALSDIASKLSRPATARVELGLSEQRLAGQQPAATAPAGRRATAESQAMLDWFRAYAFRLPESQGRRRGAVYLVGSLINHACDNWNANFSFSGDDLRVLARRDIREGEEISINYGRSRKEFHCLCAHCLRARRGRSGFSWRNACSIT